MQFIQLLQDNTTMALVVFGLLGLCVGSFLNVVIHRTPLMMIYSWRQECSQFMSEQVDMPQEHTQPFFFSMPPGYQVTSPDGTKADGGYCLRAKKALYGLPQAPRLWNIGLKDWSWHI